ncbi:MAG: preprotein translocase subunit YajC [Acidobacteria bacterium]|nr:preprotein translocase subunit YajC [Acidobacteriota bacterium]
METTITSNTLLLILADGGGSLFTSMLPLLLIFGIFYFLLIRPQQKRQKQAQLDREALLNAIKPNDKVVTNGGIYGAVVAIRDKEDTVMLKIAPSVTIEIQRASIAGLQPNENKETEIAKP